MMEWLTAPLPWPVPLAWQLTGWTLVGYCGALLFGSRWLVQFWASRRAGRPVIPRLFWYMSVLGSLMALSYFLLSPQRDSVGALQNLFPAFTAGYSLYLDIRHRGWRGRKGDARGEPW